MKNIKTYEQLSNTQTYWKIRTDEPYLEASLYKLDLPDKQIDYILTNENITGCYYDDEKLTHVYIPDSNNNIEVLDSWNACNNENENGHYSYNRKGYIYKGEVEMTLDEAKTILNVHKYTSKYNI